MAHAGEDAGKARCLPSTQADKIKDWDLITSVPLVGLSKQRYRIGKGWRSVLSSSVSFTAGGCAGA